MPVVFIKSIGANLAYIQPVEGPVDPGWGGGWTGEHPGHELPGSGAHPWFPGHIGGPRPDRGPAGLTRSSRQPPAERSAAAGRSGRSVWCCVRDQAGVWHYATLPPGADAPSRCRYPPSHRRRPAGLSVRLPAGPSGLRGRSSRSLNENARS